MSEDMKTEKPRIIRKHMEFYGDVQGVGFRWRARHGASALGVTGWVRNEWDGSVTMEAQGTEEQIRKLVAAIRRGTYVDVRDMRVKEIPLEDEYSFHVR